MSKNMNSGDSCKIRNIADIPDEILMEIISFLNARERVPLGNSCGRFHTLVFEDKKMLRDLNFSEDANLTLASDLHRYFNNENGCKHILKVNLKDVNCIAPDIMFHYISKAVNLVDINIQGITIRDRWLLRDFLRQLLYVKRLAIDWPRGAASAVGEPFCKYLQESFCRLTYFSVRLFTKTDIPDFCQALQSCRELEELHMTVMNIIIWPSQTVLHLESNNLKIIAYYGSRLREVAKYFVSALPNSEEWTHFDLYNPQTCREGFYLERNVEVCKEMFESISLKRHLYNYSDFASKLYGFVVPMCILEKVMEIKQELHSNEKYCCFSSANNEKDEGQLLLPSVHQATMVWTLRTKEAIRLLKDPRSPISYLGIFHNIEEECDVHFVASAFPSLTELTLFNITKKKVAKKFVLPGKRAKKNDIALLKPHELRNLDSSFSKLVTGTPNLKQLTIIGNTSQLEDDEDQTWDVAALGLIAGWKYLTKLTLKYIPITNGEFLIEIGKQCKQLAHISLFHLGPDLTCCYMDGFLRMLTHCSNLRDISLEQKHIGQLSEMFFLLANNDQLRRVCVSGNYDRVIPIDLRPSIEQLLYHCSKLTTLVLIDTGISEAESLQLVSTLERLKSKLNRSTFQYEVPGYRDENNTHARSQGSGTLSCVLG